MSQFYAWLGEGKSSRIFLAVMDMWKPFRLATQPKVLQAAVPLARRAAVAGPMHWFGFGGAKGIAAVADGNDGAGNLVTGVGPQLLRFARYDVANDPCAKLVMDDDRQEQTAVRREQDAGGPRFLTQGFSGERGRAYCALGRAPRSQRRAKLGSPSMSSARSISRVKMSAGDALIVRKGVWAGRKALGPWILGRAEAGRSAGLDPSVIPWLKQRDFAILGSDHPQYKSACRSPTVGRALPTAPRNRHVTHIPFSRKAAVAGGVS
jgi:hypothetical protein